MLFPASPWYLEALLYVALVLSVVVGRWTLRLWLSHWRVQRQVDAPPVFSGSVVAAWSATADSPITLLFADGKSESMPRTPVLLNALATLSVPLQTVR